MNDRWFNYKFDNEKYNKIILIIDSNLELFINNKSLDKIKSQIEYEFAKINETNNAGKFFNDVKIRVELISESLKRIINFPVFSSSRSTCSFRSEMLPKLSNKNIVQISKSPIFNSTKTKIYQSMHFESMDNMRNNKPKTIFSPIHSDTKLINLNPNRININMKDINSINYMSISNINSQLANIPLNLKPTNSPSTNRKIKLLIKDDVINYHSNEFKRR